jgi:hypothetical protein
MSTRVPTVGAVGFGALIGFCNTLFIAIGLSVGQHGGAFLAMVVFMFGIIPGLITGAALGALAARTAERPVWLRRVVLVGPAVWVLIALAAFFGVMHLFLVAIIPTVVSAFILERNTRARPTVPVAAVLK